MTVNVKETACDFLDRAIKVHLTAHEIKKIDETGIVFISDLKDITFNYYMDLPKSMICYKMIRYFEMGNEDINEYKWLPK